MSHDREAVRALGCFPWEKVAKAGPDDCWPWTGSVNSWGYGDTLWNGKRTNASRAAFESANGPVAAGMVVCHRCDNPRCCNPAHLWADTQANNLADCRSKGRQVYRRGAQHHRATARLTAAQVEDAKALYASGVTQTEIGRRLGVHAATISRAVRGESWGHVA